MYFYPRTLFKKSLSTIIVMLAILSSSNAESGDTLVIGERLFQSGGSLLTIQIYDMPRYSKDDFARTVVARKWGFRYDHSIGCLVQEGLKEMIESHNQEVYAILIKKHGVDWEKKFEEQVKNEYKKEEKIKNHLGKLPLVKKIKKDLRHKKHLVFYSFEPDTKLEMYYVSIDGSSFVDMEAGMFTFAKFIVDSKTFKVSVISDKVEKFLY
jgi:hypothetical protein